MDKKITEACQPCRSSQDKAAMVTLVILYIELSGIFADLAINKFEAGST